MVLVDRQRLKPRRRDDLIRLGKPRDGGYVVPAQAVACSEVLLSLGMKQDWSFERRFAAVNPATRVIGVDPSIGAALFARQIVTSAGNLAIGALRREGRRVRRHATVLRTSLDYFWFFRWRHRHVARLVSASDADGHIGFDELFALARPTGDHRVFVKMDIEGSEYAVIGDLLRHERHINCVVIEFHRLAKRAGLFNEAVARLQHGFQIVHIHGNNYAPYDAGNDFPDAVEITLLNRALATEPETESPGVYPRVGLDFPNTAARDDYPLRFE